MPPSYNLPGEYSLGLVPWEGLGEVCGPLADLENSENAIEDDARSNRRHRERHRGRSPIHDEGGKWPRILVTIEGLSVQRLSTRYASSFWDTLADSYNMERGPPCANSA